MTKRVSFEKANDEQVTNHPGFFVPRLLQLPARLFLREDYFCVDLLHRAAERLEMEQTF